ncbi:MAG: chromosome partitioning protein ParB, partial [Planctomycetes bacterium]|nr:chromosome partitioning protein ParB [Planctomycetota bacterium]
MSKERRLGRGLEALLGMTGDAVPAGAGQALTSIGAKPAVPAEFASGDGLLRLPLHEIEANPFQPRREFDEAEVD